MLRIRPIEQPNRITHTPCGSCRKKKAEQLNYNPFGLTYIDSASTGTSQLCSMPRIGWGLMCMTAFAFCCSCNYVTCLDVRHFDTWIRLGNAQDNSVFGHVRLLSQLGGTKATTSKRQHHVLLWHKQFMNEFRPSLPAQPKVNTINASVNTGYTHIRH